MVTKVIHIFLVLCVLFSVSAMSYAQKTATGTVFWDKNENKVIDPQENGISGVPVSNGRKVVLTNEDGIYSIEVTNKNDKVFVIKPAGYTFPTDELNRPQFYYFYKPGGSPKLKYGGVKPTGSLPESINFPLYKSEKESNFRVILVADPQAADVKEVEYFDKDIVSELVDKEGYTFGITLGDMVDEQLELFEPYSKSISKVGIPWFHVFGNNDMNLTAKKGVNADETFEATFGPTTYSFNYGNAHFIIIDNIIYPRPDGKTGYTSGITKTDLQFVKNDLKHVSKDKLVVLAFHIPIFGSFPDTDRRRLFELLREYPNTLSVSGHTHMQQFHFFDIEQGWKQLNPHMHYNVGSASGLRWSGVPDEHGIPPAMMRDGTPNGYAILNIESNSFTIDYKVADKPAEYKMSIWGPKVVPKNKPHFAQFYVNYFLGNEYTTVAYRIEGSKNWKTLRHVDEPDPHLTAIRTKWDTSEKILEGFRPVNPTKSSHLWTGVVPNDLPLGRQTIVIRVKDIFGRTFTNEYSYKVVMSKK